MCLGMIVLNRTHFLTRLQVSSDDFAFLFRDLTVLVCVLGSNNMMRKISDGVFMMLLMCSWQWVSFLRTKKISSGRGFHLPVLTMWLTSRYSWLCSLHFISPNFFIFSFYPFSSFPMQTSSCSFCGSRAENVLRFI